MEITTCQFNDSYFPIMDGVAMTAHNYAHWLNEHDVKSILIAPKVKNYVDEVDYKVYRFKSVQLPGMKPYRLGIPMADPKFKKKIKKIKFDLLHAHCPFVTGQIARRIARKQNIPLITTFHSKYREDFKKVLDNKFLINYMVNTIVEFYNAADVVWVPNKSTGNTLFEYGYKGSLEVMPNGTDLTIPDKNMYFKFRKKGLKIIDVEDSEFVMLFVGQHRWEKNVRLIIEALRILDVNKKKFKMVFVGEGYAAKDMKKLCNQYGLKDKVAFLGVITDREELKKIYAASNLFVFPSIYDNSPLVMQEAAAFSIPSIVVQGSSSAENIIDGENGFAIENDPVSLSSKISDLMKNRHAILQAGIGARTTIHNSWEGIVNTVHSKYHEILKAHRGNARHKNKEIKLNKEAVQLIYE